MLRPRHDREIDNTADASRTRPIRSNRARPRQMDRPNNSNGIPSNPISNATDISDMPTIDMNSETSGPPPSSATVGDIGLPQTGSDLSLLQALAAYNWSQNYLLSHTDPLFLHRIQQATYPSIGNVHVNQRIPQFDPWVLHNYLLAATYSAASTSHVAADAASNDEAAMRMSQMTYPSLVREIVRCCRLVLLVELVDC